jgi:hypothetical protein
MSNVCAHLNPKISQCLVIGIYLNYRLLEKYIGMSALFLPIDFTHESTIDVVVNILAHFLKKKME